MGIKQTLPSGTVPSLPVSGFTTGSVSFVSGGALAQDNAAFFWDITNDRLGLGTAAPATPLEVNGAVRATRSGVSTQYTEIGSIGSNGFVTLVGANKSLAIGALDTAGSPGAAVAISFQVGTTVAPTERMRIDNAGNVAIGNIAAFGTSAAGVLGIKNGTEPTTSPADLIQLYSVDLSAGNATLGLRTETAVVTENVVSDRTLTIKINGVNYKILLKS